MVLRQETKYGLTYGQILSTLGLLGAIIGVWVRLEIAIAELKLKESYNRTDIELIKNDVEKKRLENKDDHKLILDKIEQSHREIMQYLQKR